MSHLRPLLEDQLPAPDNLKRADGTEAAWWLGLMSGSKRIRAVRALRILVEAVK